MNAKVLRRSDDKMIAGVCGGIAEYLGWSPTATRIGFVAISAISAGFPGILVYLVLCVVMPAPHAEPRGFNVHHPDDV